MLSLQQILMFVLAALPLLVVVLLAFIFGRIKEFSVSMVFLGIFDIVVALGGGIAVLMVIVSTFPQTNSTITKSFLIGALAAMLAVALIVGEFFRYLILRSSDKNEKSSLSGICFGFGIALGEYFAFIAMSVLNSEYKISLDMTIILMVDIVMQLCISYVAYKLIQQNNFAFIAVGGLYYLSLFILMAFSGSSILMIASKVLAFLIAIGLFVAYLPGKKQA